MSETVQVNFGKPMPLFPLPDTVLLPHAILPLHIFEPRYRQMVSHCLDQTGQLAIATIDMNGCDPETNSAPLRNAVCIGQILQHVALEDGRYNIWLHGICRANIRSLIEPADDHAYRMARLAPIESLDVEPAPMPKLRRELRALLTGPRLQRLRGIETLVKYVERDDVPTHALLELIGFAVVRDIEVKYQLLAEPSVKRRASMIRSELIYLEGIVRRADQQSFRDWPKGMSWN